MSYEGVLIMVFAIPLFLVAICDDPDVIKLSVITKLFIAAMSILMMIIAFGFTTPEFRQPFIDYFKLIEEWIWEILP